MRQAVGAFLDLLRNPVSPAYYFGWSYRLVLWLSESFFPLALRRLHYPLFHGEVALLRFWLA